MPEKEEPGIRKASRREFLSAAAAAAAGSFLAAEAFGAPPGAAEAAIEERKTAEIQKAGEIIESGDPERILESPFLVSALYYSDAFFEKLGRARPEDAAEDIVARIKDLIAPEMRRAYADMLKRKATEISGEKDAGLHTPPLHAMRVGLGPNHPDALDIFAKRGAIVKSITRGIVALSEGGWRRDDPLSTSSPRGGNCVIVFDPDTARFYRYCHLGDVSVRAGERIEAGMQIGTLGRTGTNAAKPGHNTHLHLEINQYEEREAAMRALSSRQIRQELFHRLSR